MPSTPGHRGNRLDVLDTEDRLDHHDAQSAVAHRDGVAPEGLGRPHRAETPLAARMDAARFHRLASVVGGLDHGQDDAVRAGIEQPAGGGTVPGRHPDDDPRRT
jgi:hypothetical protein